MGEAPSACGCCWESDTLRDDSSLALNVPGGVFVVCGCAHSGVCSTVAATKERTGEDRVAGLFGGFHLFEAGDVLDETIVALKALGVGLVYPGHCTSLAVKAAFVRAFDAREVGVGLTLSW
ncbi:hypothetical protein SDC9_64159 [bioreactor metagenome]|uniref:Metallo-beta-lactamase domain-containing protein n=1 Tax=bioreactor metagenome TaxID=1076179 RepID=A0A644XNJ9_9ZZZZ